ncbi:hypothetical protein [Tahibacter amnicola]|uniref:DUF4148 domain-containing protein n=1 Tax=Tahibacter amnicola TaxID=2976241 RepID=A0ABY6BKP3_9GAMM|nr:hypothetical protein [Tahibacter amnicola]UXI70581.1 hypothetical protein N4264_13345 [Tahibacter amnicola]
MNVVRTLAIITALVTSSASYADTPVIDQRQENQEARIEQGVASGELTRREAARLEARQEHIENVEERAKADGVVTRRERARLERKQDRNSAAIGHQKHDRQDRKD